MPVFASALAAIIPILFYLILIWKLDRFDREPIGLYLKNFFWGAVGAIIFAVIGNIFFKVIFSLFIFSKDFLEKSEAIFIAPFVEEITKGFFLFITVTNRKFDNMTDGIVYGGAIGLGFGMTENFLYFVSNSETFSNWITTVIVRTFFTAVMHCVATGTFGAFLGYAKFKPIIYKLIFTPLGLFIAIFIHFLWNVSVSFTSTTLLGFLFLTCSIVFFMTIFSLSLSKERKMIYLELLEEADNGLIPKEHLNILNSKERENTGWIDEKIRKNYVVNATTLAFRKMEFKNSHGYNKFFYEKEIEYYRNELKVLLNPNQIV